MNCLIFVRDCAIIIDTIGPYMFLFVGVAEFLASSSSAKGLTKQLCWDTRTGKVVEMQRTTYAVCQFRGVGRG